MRVPQAEFFRNFFHFHRTHVMCGVSSNELNICIHVYVDVYVDIYM